MREHYDLKIITMKNFLLFQFFAFVIIASAFSQDASVQFINVEGQDKVVVASDKFGTVAFDYGHWPPPQDITDYFIDDKYCVVVVRTPKDFYRFASAYKHENKWYVDHRFGLLFFEGDYYGLFGRKIKVNDVSIINGGLLEIQYDLTTYKSPLDQNESLESQTACCEIRQNGVYDLNSSTSVYWGWTQYPHSPRN